MEPIIAVLSPSSKKQKKSTPKKFLILQLIELSSSKIKKILIFWEMKVSSPRIKKVLTFSLKKVFLYFRKRNFFRKTSYISGSNFPSSKKKTRPEFFFFIFQEMELSRPKELHNTFLY